MGAKLLAQAKADNPPDGKKPVRRSSMTAKQKAREEIIDKAELFWLDAKFKLAKVDFFMGQTWLDDATEEGKKKRTELLKQAAKTFYDIYQLDRASLVGLLAHTWEGKTQDALGDQDLAQEIYQEVLVLTPDKSDEKAAGLAKVDAQQQSLFCEVKYFSMLILLKQNAKDFSEEAETWLKDYKAWAKNEGYQGITFELAKLYLADAENALPEQRGKIRKEAESLLKSMKSISSEFHQAAGAKLRALEASGSEGPPADPKSARRSHGSGRRRRRIAEMGRRGQMVQRGPAGSPAKLPGSKRQAAEASLEQKLDTSRFNLGWQLPGGRQGQRRSDRDRQGICSTNSIRAAKLAPKVGTLSGPHGPAQPAAGQRRGGQGCRTERAVDGHQDGRGNLARQTRSGRCPHRPGRGQPGAKQAGRRAESVRRGQSAFGPLSAGPVGRGQDAPAVLLDAEQHKPNHGDAETVKKELAAARQQLEKSVELQGTPADPTAVGSVSSRPSSGLAEVDLMSGDAAKAAELLQPIIDGFQQAAPGPLDPTQLKAFSAAVRAYATTNQLVQAGAVAAVLLDRGQDDVRVNKVLLGFAAAIQAEYKLASAAAIEAASDPDLSKRMAAEPRLTTVKELAGNLLPRLAERKSNTPQNLIFIGDLAMQVAQSELADTIFHKILDQAQADPAFAKACGDRGLTRVRSQLVELLREKKQFAEGVKQADTLIEQNPKSLEPLMAKGRLLQAWAEEDHPQVCRSRGPLEQSAAKARGQDQKAGRVLRGGLQRRLVSADGESEDGREIQSH